MSDRSIGMLNLAANAHWKAAPWYTRAAVWLFGRHELVEHLGMRFRIGWWRGKPYLVTVREVA